MRIFMCIGDAKAQSVSLDAVHAKNRLYAYSNFWDWLPWTKRGMFDALKLLQTARGNGECLLVDSGVAVLNNRFFAKDVLWRRGRIPFSETDLDDLVHGYVQLLTAAHKVGCVDVAMEMDADHFVGYPKVKEYRKRLVDSGVRIIPVWRPTLGEDEYYRLIEQYDWISLSEGIAGISVNGREAIQFFRKMVENGVAQKAQRYHFFAGLRRSLLFGCPLYSADSTTWSAFSRWALTTRWNPKQLWMDWSGAGYGKIAYDKIDQMGIEGIPFNPKSQEYVDAIAAKAYVRLEGYVTDFWRRKGVVFND